MSSSERHLAEWIRALIQALDAGEPRAAAAIRRIAGDRRASIALDADRVSVRFEPGRLVVRRRPPAATPAAPSGVTDRAAVAAILAGYLEVPEAVAAGRLELRGRADDVVAMCAILEVLVDAATRVPAMQDLARAFLAGAPTEGARADRADRRARSLARSARERVFFARERLG